MASRATITVPSSTADKLAELGRAMVKLAQEMKGYEGTEDDQELLFRIPELKRPNLVTKGDAWFWSDEWQKGEREVNEQLATGRYDIFESVEELIVDLHHLV